MISVEPVRVRGPHSKIAIGNVTAIQIRRRGRNADGRVGRIAICCSVFDVHHDKILQGLLPLNGHFPTREAGEDIRPAYSCQNSHAKGLDAKGGLPERLSIGQPLFERHRFAVPVPSAPASAPLNVGG